MLHGPTLKNPNQKRVRNDLVDWGLFKIFFRLLLYQAEIIFEVI